MEALINVLTLIAAVMGFVIFISGLIIFFILKENDKSGSIRIVSKVFIIIGLVLIIPFIGFYSINYFNRQKEMADNGPLKTAVINRDTDKVKSLLESGTNPNKGFKGDSPLIEALKNDDFETAKLLIEHGADVNTADKYRDTPLMVALKYIDGADLTEILNILFSKDVNIGTRNEMGETPLLLACQTQGADIVRRLIDKGADMNVVEDNGDTCLIIASYYGNYDVADLLIKKGADVNAKNKYSNTALMKACQGDNYVKVVRLLIDKGANVNERDQEDRSPLMYACDTNYYMNANVVGILLQKGADVQMVDTNGQSALDYINKSFDEASTTVSSYDQDKQDTFVNNYKRILQMLSEAITKAKGSKASSDLTPEPM